MDHARVPMVHACRFDLHTSTYKKARWPLPFLPHTEYENSYRIPYSKCPRGLNVKTDSPLGAVCCLLSSLMIGLLGVSDSADCEGRPSERDTTLTTSQCTTTLIMSHDAFAHAANRSASSRRCCENGSGCSQRHVVAVALWVSILCRCLCCRDADCRNDAQD